MVMVSLLVDHTSVYKFQAPHNFLTLTTDPRRSSKAALRSRVRFLENYMPKKIGRLPNR